MSATTSSPTRSQAGGSTCPYFGAANVTVSAALSVVQAVSPLSDERPEGMSTATSGERPGSGRSARSRIALPTRPAGS